MSPLARISIAGCATLGLVVWAAGCGSDPPGPRNNILILVADDLGVDGVGAYGEGSDPPPTPNIDALAARGVLFRNAWSNPVCSPTRALIMTGRYSFRTGIGSARERGAPELPLDEITIPEAFDAARSGYANAMIGKWHVSDGPRGPARAGWGYYVEGPLSLLLDYYEWPRTVNGVETVSTTYATTQLVDDALEWIDRQQGPWLCYLSFYSPHGPWVAPPRELHTRDLSAAESQRYSPAYFKATVETLDSEIGRLLRSLGSRLESTNVIFIGDNGAPSVVTEPPFNPKHAKGTPYEGGVNVPLIVAGPAVRSPGREEPALVSAVDLFATTLELGGIDVRKVIPRNVPIDSVSFVPYLRDPGQAPLRSTVFAERFDNHSWKHMDTVGFATVRDRRYKLIRFFNKPHDEFYDLEADPWEEHDLLGGTAGADGTHPDGALSAEQRSAYEALSAEIESLRAASP